MKVTELKMLMREKYGTKSNAFRTSRHIQLVVPGHMIGFGCGVFGRIAKPGDDCPCRVPPGGNAALRHTGYAFGTCVFGGASVIGLARRLGLSA